MDDAIVYEDNDLLIRLQTFGRFYLDVWDLIDKAGSEHGELAIIAIEVDECVAIKNQVYPYLKNNLPTYLAKSVILGQSNNQHELLLAMWFKQRGESYLAAHHINAILNELDIKSLHVKYTCSESLQNIYPDTLIAAARKSQLL